MTDRPTIDATSFLDPAEVGRVTELVETAAAEDGFAALNEAALLGLRHPAADTLHLTAHVGGVLVGYAARLGTGRLASAVLVVSPSARRRGLGDRLLTQLLASDPELSIWAMHDTEPARRLAAEHQLRRVRELLIMIRPTDRPVAEPVVANGTRIRTFAVGTDEPAWLRVNARAFASHPEQGGITRADLDARMAEPWFDPAGFFLAETHAQVVGFHWTKQHLDGRGEVYVLGVDPDVGGAGLGTALLRTGLAHLAEVGAPEVLLYVEGDHPRAVVMYAANGFTVSSRDVMYAQPVRPSGPPPLRFKPPDTQEN